MIVALVLREGICCTVAGEEVVTTDTVANETEPAFVAMQRHDSDEPSFAKIVVSTEAR